MKVSSSRRGRGGRGRERKAGVRLHLAREARRIERRLKEAVRENRSGPVLGRANVVYEVAERSGATPHGGMGLVAGLVGRIGLAEEINSSLRLLSYHRPYYESDHVLNVAYNALCGGRRLEDIELRRTDRVFLDALGTVALPDPTTAGDFCRRFAPCDVMALQEAFNRARLAVWARQDRSFVAECARIDADATIIATDATTKGGMDLSYQGIWGYSALVVDLANTGEPLFLALHGANRPSHEGVIPLYDRAVGLCRAAGFTDILLRGDTDFSLTTEFDRWDTDGVRFVFGYDAKANLIARADELPDDLYHELTRRAERAVKTQPRRRPENIKARIVKARGYKNTRTAGEDVVEFSYRPVACGRDYRIVALRKNLSVERGENVLIEQFRYFFYVTNDWDLTADEVVAEARDRCNQENLNAQLKGGVRALHAPVNTLTANWAYMTMAALAWSLKAWCALLVPVAPRWKKQHLEARRRLLRMEFRTFLNVFINIPCQIIQGARQVRWRFQAWNPWLGVFFRLADTI
jgi:DDE family transposase